MRYTEQEKEWLIKNYPRMGNEEATRRFNEIFNHSQTTKAIGRFCNVHGVYVDADVTKTLMSRNHNHVCKNINGRRYYEEEEKEWLRENYPKLGVKETTRQFNERFNHNKKAMAIKKYCKFWLNLSVPKEVTLELKSVPIGYSYKNCRGEWRVKTENGWIPLSHLNREVPKGHIAFHLDGDIDNNSPENIAIIKNGIQTIARNCELLSENPTIT